MSDPFTPPTFKPLRVPMELQSGDDKFSVVFLCPRPSRKEIENRPKRFKKHALLAGRKDVDGIAAAIEALRGLGKSEEETKAIDKAKAKFEAIDKALLDDDAIAPISAEQWFYETVKEWEWAGADGSPVACTAEAKKWMFDQFIGVENRLGDEIDRIAGDWHVKNSSGPRG